MQALDRSQNADALYAQIVARFRTQIRDGSLPPGSRLPTEHEIASQYQISRTTVRQAMGELVNEGLLERIQGRGTFVRQAGNPPAASAAERRIGVVLTHAGDQLNMEILIGVEQAARSRGYLISFTYAEESRALQTRDILRLQADRVAGLVIFPLSNTAHDPTIAQLQAARVPLVLVDRYLAELETDYVVSDNFGGGYRATEHLIILGHTRIAFVHRPIGDRHTSSVHDRWAGYCQALRDYGLPYDEALVRTYHEPIQGQPDTFFDALLSQPGRPGAFFLVNDQSAPALFQAARRLGLRLPDDIAVVGFDDLSFAQLLSPPLTTVRQPRLDIGLRAGHLLLDRIEGYAEPPRRIVLPTQLIVRESCGVRLRARRTAT